MELRPMVGHLSYKQFTQVRFLQLRLCFSGAKDAQLFRNQQAIGSIPMRSYYAGIVQWSVRVFCNHLISVRIRVSALQPSYGVSGRFESGFCNWCPIRTLFIKKVLVYNYHTGKKYRELKQLRRNTAMVYTMICKQHKHEEKRFWFFQDRSFVMPCQKCRSSILERSCFVKV